MVGTFEVYEDKADKFRLEADSLIARGRCLTRHGFAAGSSSPATAGEGVKRTAYVSWPPSWSRLWAFGAGRERDGDVRVVQVGDNPSVIS